MRAARLWRFLAVLALLSCLACGAAAYVCFRRALNAKIDRAAELERAALLPAAAARLESALLERRLSSISHEDSRAVAAAFQSADASRALADYRAAGGDPAIAAEAGKSLASEKPPGPDAEIALMRAIRGLRAQISRLPPASRPSPPPDAAPAGELLIIASFAGIAALLAAYASGRAAGSH